MINLLSFGYLGVFLFSFVINMVPFMSPSNLIIAGAVGVILPWMNPFIAGFLLAMASSLAKLIHFYTSFFVGRAFKLKGTNLENYRTRVGKVGPILIFLAAISPIPDDPIVVPLGLMKYNPQKFFIIFFSGKIIVTTLGTLTGSTISLSLTNLFGSPFMVVLAVILTIVITYIFLKVDLEDLFEKILYKIRNIFSQKNS